MGMMEVEKRDEEPEKKAEEEEEEEEDDDKEEQEEDNDEDEEPPKAELTPEEKKQWFIQRPTPDLAPYVLSSNFTKFSLPEKDDGFDEIKYEWNRGQKCQEYVK